MNIYGEMRDMPSQPSLFARRLKDAIGRRSYADVQDLTDDVGFRVTEDTVRRYALGLTKRLDPYKVAAIERGLALPNGDLARLAGIDVVPPDAPLEPPVVAPRARAPDGTQQILDKLSQLQKTVDALAEEVVRSRSSER